MVGDRWAIQIGASTSSARAVAGTWRARVRARAARCRAAPARMGCLAAVHRPFEAPPSGCHPLLVPRICLTRGERQVASRSVHSSFGSSCGARLITKTAPRVIAMQDASQHTFRTQQRAAHVWAHECARGDCTGQGKASRRMRCVCRMWLCGLCFMATVCTSSGTMARDASASCTQADLYHSSMEKREGNGFKQQAVPPAARIVRKLQKLQPLAPRAGAQKKARRLPARQPQLPLTAFTIWSTI